MVDFSYKRTAPFRQDPLITAVAQMSDGQLLAMDRDDLLEVIRLSRGLNALASVFEDLNECDHDTLLGFALLARDKCRRELRSTVPRFHHRSKLTR
jgi:hypothetical protein